MLKYPFNYILKYQYQRIENKSNYKIIDITEYYNGFYSKLFSKFMYDRS